MIWIIAQLRTQQIFALLRIHLWTWASQKVTERHTQKYFNV